MVEMEEIQVQTDREDDGSLDMEDMDNEDILYLDFIDDSDDDEDESGDEEDFFWDQEETAGDKSSAT